MFSPHQLLPLQEAAQGCLLGLACGDALGSAQEHTTKQTVMPIADLQGGGPFGLQAGQWADDTAMALCLSDSLLACGGFDSRDEMTRYLNWWQGQYRGGQGHVKAIGQTVETALKRFQASGNPWAGDTDPFTAGNGALMRVAPVALFYHGERQSVLRAMKVAAWQAMLTHGEQRAVQACQLVTWLIWQALEGERDLDRWLEPNQLMAVLKPFGEQWHPDIADIISGSYRRKEAFHIRATGYVIHTLEAALWALWHCDDFASGALLAANLGEEAGTTAAVYGQLAGAFYGLTGIPEHWRQKIWQSDEIIALATNLIGIEPKEPSEEELRRVADHWAKRLGKRDAAALLSLMEADCQHHQLLVSIKGHEWLDKPLVLHPAEICDYDREEARHLLSLLIRSQLSVAGTLQQAWDNGLLVAIFQRLAS